MNQSYSQFKEQHFKYLLDGQSEILGKLEEEFFPQLNKQEASYFPTLVRMPTGTGKTGVIAIASFFGNSRGSTLILTPWKNLCTQMMEDLKTSFWNKVKLSQAEKDQYVFETDRFWPSRIGKLLEKKAEDRFIIVGTFNGLQRLESNNPILYDELKKRISLVIVDEGHYEPAVLWGRAIKHLNRPSLILTATPYRNDLRLFQVPAEKVFHYEHWRAVKAKKNPIRKTDSIELKANSKDFEAMIHEFLSLWKTHLKNTLPDRSPRAIICCQNKLFVMKALELVFDEGFSVLAFHERVEDDDFDHRPELKDLFIRNVPLARKTDEEIWIHQNKLTEGVDDPRFCSILFTYTITNDRKLVQQVGRVLRHSSQPRDQKEQKAIIVHCADYDFKDVWDSYLNYEKMIELTTGEHYREVISKYLELQPPYEYFGRRFRKRLAPFPPLGDQNADDEKTQAKNLKSIKKIIDQWQKEAWETIFTSPSVLILKIHTEFDINEFVGAMTDGLLLRDAVILNVEGENKPIIFESDGPVFWLYALIKNADILLSRSAYEISIEARYIHRVRNYLFIGDTSGVAYEEFYSKFAYGCNYFDLVKCLNDDAVVRQASLFNTQSLNTAIRRTIRQGINLDDAPYQISESKYVCQNLRAKRDGVAGERYYGLTTGRISDRIGEEKRREFNLQQFIEWVTFLADTLDDVEGKTHPFFSRFASIASAPSAADPYALILDPDPDPAMAFEPGNAGIDINDKAITWITKKQEKVELEETVFVFETTKNDEWPYSISIQIEHDNPGKPLITQIECRYEPGKRRFQFRKGGKSEFEVIYNNDVFPVAQLLNTHHDRYAITLKEPELVYHNRQFFNIDYSQSEAKFTNYFLKITSLKNVNCEKIPSEIKDDGKRNLEFWPDRTVFNITLSKILTKTQFGEEIEWLYCDDPNKEIADFIMANFTKRVIVFAHCKYGKGSRISVSVFHELCSQAAKSLVYFRTRRNPPNINHWNRNALWEGTKIKRWRIGTPDLPENEDLWAKIRAEILNHPAGKKNIWLILGNGLEVSELLRIAGSDQETQEVGPLIHLLDGLVANCSEAGVGLRVFGN